MRYWQTWQLEEGSEPTIETNENDVIETLEEVIEGSEQETEHEGEEETGENVEVVESVPDEQDNVIYDHLEEISKNSIACVYLLSALLLFTILRSVFSGVTK